MEVINLLTQPPDLPSRAQGFTEGFRATVYGFGVESRNLLPLLAAKGAKKATGSMGSSGSSGDGVALTSSAGCGFA